MYRFLGNKLLASESFVGKEEILPLSIKLHVNVQLGKFNMDELASLYV